GWAGDIDDAQSLRIRDERVAELNCDRRWLVDACENGNDARLERLVDVDDDEAIIATDVEPAAGDGDRICAGEHAHSPRTRPLATLSPRSGERGNGPLVSTRPACRNRGNSRFFSPRPACGERGWG